MYSEQMIPDNELGEKNRRKSIKNKWVSQTHKKNQDNKCILESNKGAVSIVKRITIYFGLTRVYAESFISTQMPMQ